MPATVETPVAPQLRHEEFCLPREGEDKPRVERYEVLGDDPASGRSRPTHKVTRCLECGAASYKKIGA